MNIKPILILILFFNPISFLLSQDITNEVSALEWPREIQKDNATITLYQPQLESFQNNLLEGRMAISIKPKKGDLYFGAIWFKAKMNTDLEERIVMLESIDITDIRFPEENQQQIEKNKHLLEKDIEGMNIVMSLDHLLADLDMEENQKSISENLNNDPPKIYYRSTSTVLIYVDGDPILKDTSDPSIKYVVNTPYFIVQDQHDKRYYIKGGKFWYQSSSINKGWSPTDIPPKVIQQIADEALKDQEQGVDSAMMEMTTPPEIIVSTEPAELILTDGKPDFKPIDGTSLLYLSNSESDILMDIQSQQYFILIAGRWFASKSLENGPWKFIEPDQLPSDFSNIPAESEVSNVRVSIPGTEEARGALLEQSIPQTASVDRKTATVSVDYDGEPKFEKIDNSKVSYAVNADKTVLQINSKYYCVDDAIWFESTKATGPWEVSVSRPDEVDDIPPESPVYNVKYVYIYDYTPSVVYVGYTPGYTCSYVYNGVVVYGTGYYYRPWYYSYYYPRPVTYGFSVHYNPWTGWGFSYGISYGWFSIGFHHSYYNWWGPGGYHYGYRHGYYHGYHHGYYHGYNRGYAHGYYQGRKDGYSPGRPTHYNNVYRDRSTRGTTNTGIRTRDINTSRPSTGRQPTTTQRPTNNQRPTTREAQPSTRQNNVFTDRNGNVYRRDQSGNYQQRSNGNWNSQPSTRQNNSNLNRDYQQRQRGSQNYNNYNRSRTTSKPSTGTMQRSGGSRGGGSRRR